MQPLIKFALLPILIPQGLWTKWKTPRLPEAEGERQGTHGLINAKKHLQLLILGDSAAAGVGVDQQQEALIGQLCEQFPKQDYYIDWQLHATSGHHLGNMIERVKTLPEQKFDLVIISSGVNDVIAQHSVQQWQKNYLTLYQDLENKFASPHIIFSAVPPIQHFKALPRLLAWFLGQQAALFNHNLQTQTPYLKRLHYVPLNLPIAPEYLAKDGFHPSHLSYTIWAQQLVNYLEKTALI